jgi:hypothetical protein
MLFGGEMYIAERLNDPHSTDPEDLITDIYVPLTPRQQP